MAYEHTGINMVWSHVAFALTTLGWEGSSLHSRYKEQHIQRLQLKRFPLSSLLKEDTGTVPCIIEDQKEHVPSLHQFEVQSSPCDVTVHLEI